MRAKAPGPDRARELAAEVWADKRRGKHAEKLIRERNRAIREGRCTGAGGFCRNKPRPGFRTCQACTDYKRAADKRRRARERLTRLGLPVPPELAAKVDRYLPGEELLRRARVARKERDTRKYFEAHAAALAALIECRDAYARHGKNQAAFRRWLSAKIARVQKLADVAGGKVAA